jgi:hypothetical protein
MPHGSPELLHAKLLRDRTLVLEVKVIPRSQTSQVCETMPNGAIKVKVTAPPEKGKANDEVCSLLAAYFDVPKRNVEVILGHTSPKKRVRILLTY